MLFVCMMGLIYSTHRALLSTGQQHVLALTDNLDLIATHSKQRLAVDKAWGCSWWRCCCRCCCGCCRSCSSCLRRGCRQYRWLYVSSKQTSCKGNAAVVGVGDATRSLAAGQDTVVPGVSAHQCTRVSISGLTEAFSMIYTISTTTRRRPWTGTLEG